MKRIFYGLIITGFLGVSVFGQIVATTEDGKTVILNADKTWRYLNKSDESQKTSANSLAQLSLTTGLVFRSGSVVPVSRTKFYLLDKHAEKVIISSRLRSIIMTEAKSTRDWYAGSNFTSYATAMAYGLLYPNYVRNASKALEDNALHTVTTDFNGKASFPRVKPGKYFVFGAARIRKNAVVWHLEVNLEKDGQLVLDQNNTVR